MGKLRQTVTVYEIAWGISVVARTVIKIVLTLFNLNK